MKALLARDLLLATRAGSGAALGLAFYLVIILITALGIGRAPDLLARAAPGALWSGALLATLLSLDRLFQADHEDGTLDALALAPMPLEAAVLAKTLAHWLTTGVPLTILSPLMGLMMQLPGPAYGWMLASLAVGTLGLSGLGAIGAAITLGVRRGGLLLSLLVMPLCVPALVFGVETVRAAATGADPVTAFLLLAGLTLGTMALAPLAAAAALRINMR